MNKINKILLLAFVLRVIGIYIFRNIDNYDLRSYFQVGELTYKGINIYPEVADLHHPYFPFFLYIEGLAFWLGRLKIIVITIIKIINIIFDLGNLYLVYLLSKKNLKSAFFYAVNPVSILIFTLHGQFDTIPIFFLLFSLYLIKVRKYALSIIIFSFAVMVKTWPLLFVINFYKRLKNKKLILLFLVFPIISVMLYTVLFKTPVISIVKTMIGYQGLWGIWGLWVLWGIWRLRWQKLSTIVFLISFFGYSFFNKRKNLIEEILNLLLFFFVFTSNFSNQYFSWLIPFLAIVKPKKYWLLTFAIAVYLTLSYSTWFSSFVSPTSITIVGLSLWFLLASFFLMAYRKK